MIEKKTSLKLMNLILLGLIIFMFHSCSSYNKMGSLSRPYLKIAKSQLKSGQNIDAIYSATKGVVADVKYTETKEFLYENYDTVMWEIKSELLKYEDTKDTAQAVRRLYINQVLLGINSNLSKMKLPLEHHKKKWQWSTEIIDYTEQIKASKKHAYFVFYSFARENLFESKESKDVQNANSVFRKAYYRYTKKESDERKESQINITDELCNYADLHKNAATWSETRLAAYAFFYAKAYNPDTTRAHDGYIYSAKRVSMLLTNEAKELTSKGDIKSLLLADSRYRSAIEWNKENGEARKLKEELPQIIAEAYYIAGMEAESAADGFENSLDLYKNALKWIPGYKDCQAKIYILSIKLDLKALQTNLAITQTEYNSTFSKIKTLSKGVDNTKGTMDKITYVSDNMRNINKTAKTISSALSPLCGLPVIGTVLSITNKSVSTLRIPVDKSVSYFNRTEKPLITPTKNAVEKTKTTVDLIKKAMNITALVIINTKNTVVGLESCINKVKDEETLKQSSIAINELNSGVIKMNNELKNFNETISSVSKASNEINSIVSFVQPVADGINRVKPAMKKIGDGANEVNKVLNKKVAGYSVRDALKLTGPLKWIMDKALGFLDPVLNKFSNSLPQIPGTDALMTEIDKFEQKHNVLNKEADKIKVKYDKYNDIQDDIINNLNVLVEKTGCGVGVGR